MSTWIYRAALNVAISWTRSETKHRNGKQTLDGIEPALRENRHAHDPRLERLYASA